MLLCRFVQTVTNANFGPLVAYLVPGVTVLSGFVPYSPTLQHWFATSSADAPTIGGFLYLTVASLAAGMILSAVRWAAVDTIHALTGLPAPDLNYRRLSDRVEAIALLIEIHYRHYLFYANMLVATAIAYLAYRVSHGLFGVWDWRDLGVFGMAAVFFGMSRDTLRKYYRRSEQVLSVPARRPRRDP